MPFWMSKEAFSSTASFGTSAEQDHFNSTEKKPLLETRDRFKQMFIHLQSGQFKEAVDVVESCYSRGYSLPKNDVFMLVSRLTDGNEFELANRLLSIFEKYDPRFVIRNASLFCYVLLLSGDMTKAFSLISRVSDQVIAEWTESKTSSPRSPQSPPLPQEYLFVRLCIQMLNNSKGINGNMSPFSPTLPRRNAEEQKLPLHFEEIITCYVFSWQYLLAALHRKAHNNHLHSVSSEEYAMRDPQNSQDLKELFPSPYTSSEDTHSLDTCQFSSFTLQHGEELVRTTLRSLSLVLWYFYSRSVYEIVPLPSPSTQSSEDLLQTVYEAMHTSFQSWSPSIFHFFLFFFSQPTRCGPASLAMRSTANVMELLRQMQGKVPLPDALALMLLKKPDLPVESLKAITGLFLDENQPRIRLQEQLDRHLELFQTYLAELARRGAAEEVEAFYHRLRYLSLPLTAAMANEVLLVACYTERRALQEEILRDMREKALRVTDEVAACVLFERRDAPSAGVVMELVTKGKEWKLCLSHLLLQLEEAPTPSHVVQEVCRCEGVRLDAETCVQLVPFYVEKQDYRNLLRLEAFVARRKLTLPAAAQEMMSDVTETVRTSESRLFGRGSILEGNVKTKKQRVLARQNAKYLDDCAKPLVKQMMSLFRREERSVSIDTIMNSAVREFCLSSIHEYDSWLWNVFNKGKN